MNLSELIEHHAVQGGKAAAERFRAQTTQSYEALAEIFTDEMRGRLRTLAIEQTGLGIAAQSRRMGTRRRRKARAA